MGNFPHFLPPLLNEKMFDVKVDYTNILININDNVR